MRKEDSEKGLKPLLEGADGIFCRVHDEEIEELFWREGEKQKTQDAKGSDSGAYWVDHSLQFFGVSAQCFCLKGIAK